MGLSYPPDKFLQFLRYLQSVRRDVIRSLYEAGRAGHCGCLLREAIIVVYYCTGGGTF